MSHCAKQRKIIVVAFTRIILNEVRNVVSNLINILRFPIVSEPFLIQMFE